MVEYTLQLDSIFSSLADSTRRDILRRVLEAELTVSEIAAPYDMSLAAISKHLKILEKAQLIMKRRHGKQLFVSAQPDTLKQANEYLQDYQTLWNDRHDMLETLLKEE